MLNRLLKLKRIVKVNVVEGGRHAERFYTGIVHGGSGGGDLVATPVKTVALSPLIPDSPLPRTNTDTKAASLSELLDWRNQNSVSFAWNDTLSLFWVIEQDEHKLTPELSAAIREQQTVVKAMSVSVEPQFTGHPLGYITQNRHAVSSEEFFTALAEAKPYDPNELLTDEEFFGELRDM